MEYIFLYTLFSQLISDRSKWYAHTHTHDTHVAHITSVDRNNRIVDKEMRHIRMNREYR